MRLRMILRLGQFEALRFWCSLMTQKNIEKVSFVFKVLISKLLIIDPYSLRMASDRSTQELIGKRVNFDPTDRCTLS